MDMSSEDWLRSLSEDWPSRTASPIPSKPTTRHGTATSSFKASRTKTPQPGSAHSPSRRLSTTPNRNASIVLNERTPSDINIAAPKSSRTPSKLSHEPLPQYIQARPASPSVSESQAGSVIRSSPNKTRVPTPDWQKRLLKDDRAYGEPLYLFPPAGAGLKEMFKPLPTAKASLGIHRVEDSDPERHETTLPSSPPLLGQQYSSSDVYTDKFTEQPSLPEHIQPAQAKGRSFKYRPADQGRNDTSQVTDLSAQPEVLGEGAASGLNHASTRALAPVVAELTESRRTSSQSAARHEDFSPVLVVRHGSQDGEMAEIGEIDFAPMQLSPADLQQRLEKLKRDPTPSGDSAGGSSRTGGKSASTEPAVDLRQLGSFVNLRRGGQSVDDSLRHHMSTPALGNTSDMLPEESLQASTPKQFPSLRIHEVKENNHLPKTPDIPAASFPSPDTRHLQAQGSAGSPLKLFGLYDTFTNQTLLRRISQFEDPNTSPSSNQPSHERKRSEGTSGDVPRGTPGPKKPTQASKPHSTPSRSFSQFGAGQLDGYEFDQAFSSLSNESGDESVLHRSISFNVINSSPQGDGNVLIGKRRPNQGTMSAAQFRTLSGAASRAVSAGGLAVTPRHGVQEYEYKRPRTSPSKDPTPKRRRTLHESDIAFGIEDESVLDSIQLTHQQMHMPTAGKRKNAPACELHQVANGKLLASRETTRPQTPSPGRNSSVRREEHADQTSLAPEQDSSKRSQGDPQKAQRPPKLPDEGGRKPSIRTEDFINEAHRIMAAIRGKDGPHNRLASVEESEAEHNERINEPPLPDSPLQESTVERFSRPPSREGKPVSRMMPRLEDPELLNRLKMYEEHSDAGDIVASSLRSLGISDEDIRAVRALEQHSRDFRPQVYEDKGLGENGVVSSPANIRIGGRTHRYEHTTSAEQAQQFRDRFPPPTSSSESGFSTGRSIHTGSSRGSDTRRTIAPQSVSHLIPDQVGGMFWDEQRKRWVEYDKQGSTRLAGRMEDDVFADIPDLTVDLTRELQDLKTGRGARVVGVPPSAVRRSASGSAQSLFPRNPLKSILIKESVSRQDRSNNTTRSPTKLMRDFAEQDDEDVEHEMTIHEDRLQESSPKRPMTISFSSPIASIIQDVVNRGSAEEQDTSVLQKPVVDMAQAAERHGRRTVSFQSINSSNVLQRPRGSSIMPSRRMSVQGQSFVPRPVSVIEEESDEKELEPSFQKSVENSFEPSFEKSFISHDGVRKNLSIVGNRGLGGTKPSQGRQTSVSIMFKKSGRPAPVSRTKKADVISQHVGNLSLSALSDFAAHNDRSFAFELSYVVGDQYLVTGDGRRQRMSQAVRHLVDKLAEVEPLEPYWEEMKDIGLRGMGLGSLHMLDRFCGRLVKMDASHNSIRALDGIPPTVRELDVGHNLLSELTSWDRLANLQYVNVSNNEIKSLSAFRGLVHLRGLVADNCGLVNMDGIKWHDSLQSLRARDNSIEMVDFDSTSLQRLTSLDLEGNRVQKLENLHELVSLSYLNLKGNRLVRFSSERVVPLKHLVISQNKLRRLDVGSTPRLHLLYADGNKLTTVNGLARAPHLDSLSLTEQSGSKPFDMSFFSETAYEVRKLFLSGNRLGRFEPTRDYLNLQLLDVANCGLQRLPNELGEMMPNLRLLNLNFNGLSDISGLVCIPRLKRLLVAGNRLVEVKPLLKVVGEFPWLTELDLRGNPISQGFYPPTHVIVGSEGEAPGTDSFKLPDADPERDARYCSRLDMDTRIQRRVYERKLIRTCEKLQKLDGLAVYRRVRHVKDVVWKSMVLRGMLLRPDGLPYDLSQCRLEDEQAGTTCVSDDDDDDDDDDEEEEEGYHHTKATAKSADEISRWGAEDSFAG